MRVAITGATGLVGSALVPSLTAAGAAVTRLVRTEPAETDIVWDPRLGHVDADRLEGLDAVVHLAGENIAARRWNAEQKERIRASRIQGTTLLCRTLARLRQPPALLLSASAIGLYGDRGEEVLSEKNHAGQGFLPDVCREWEKATQPAAEAGIRVVHLRFGVILSRQGGALAKMLPPFRLGLGGPMGDGRQWMSWIALDDVLGCIQYALLTARLQGPVNVVSPIPVTNRRFAKTLAHVLGRPALVPMPGFLARLAFGEMARELLLASTRVVPQALVAAGYHFRYADLEHALRHLLGKEPALPGDQAERRWTGSARSLEIKG